MLKIFSVQKEDPIFEHQSLSKPLKDTYWDISSNLILFSDENERQLVSLLYFSETHNPNNTVLKRFIKVPSFVEKISGSIDNDKIGFGTRTGELLTVDCGDVRKYFNKNKNDISIKKVLKVSLKQNTIIHFCTKGFGKVGLGGSGGGLEQGQNEGFLKGNCIRALKFCDRRVGGKNFGVFGTVDGFVGLIDLG